MRNINAFAEESRQASLNETSTTTAGSAASQAYESQLDTVLQKLREQVRQQRVALDQLKGSNAGTVLQRNVEDKRAKLRQLRSVKSAFENISSSEPHLPESTSILPAVLALRTLQRTITGSKDAVATTRRDLAATKTQLQRERATFTDAQAMNDALNNRIVVLQQAAASRVGQDPEDIATSLVQSRQVKKLSYESETQRLHDALVRFTNTSLGAMIAAEELGGPVVGEGVEVDDSELLEGSTGGRKRKAASMDQDSRQRRIDEIWGSYTREPHDHDHDHEHEHDDTDGPVNERAAAAAELHSLIERLIQALGGTTGEGVHVRLDRDSAAARFLVRAKVAQYHPKDARRLTLIDFGREIDD